MTTPNTTRLLAAAGLLCATLLGGCNDNHGSIAGPPAAPQPAIFSAFVTQIFGTDANATPVSVDLTLDYDVDNDPTAFDGLLT
jgi:hypothetical protein